MKNSFIKVQLTTISHIQVLIFTAVPRSGKLEFVLFKAGKAPEKLELVKSTSVGQLSIFELDLKEPFEVGYYYSLSVTGFPLQNIDASEYVFFKEFDDNFTYNGDDLGARYTKEYTDFALWAPLASSVFIRFSDQSEMLVMKRTEKGVYRRRVNGDLLNKKYVYVVTNSGVSIESTDPYGFGASENSLYSAVVDINKIKAMGNVKLPNKLDNYVDAIIYETNVRDFTEQNGDATDIVNRGKYLGFVEPNRKTRGGHVAGLDYLKELGITTVQLNPILDFGSVDDLNTEKKYNWGYDPISFFAIEGSYSLHPEIPMERLIEFKTLVNKLHEAGIRVVIDVVYNHIFEYMSSSFQKCVPDYYFRRRKDGNLACASGCGDDFASERPMGHKIIVDSMKYLVDVFDIDGFRFDLMGLIDIKTINEGVSECKKIKDDLIFYGEGWNMGDLPYEDRACSDNHDKIPYMGFFNDTFRDVVKGSTFDRGQKGYIGGDVSYAFGLKHVVHGCIIDVNYNARFSDANQSVNYVECHDNNTLFDKLRISNPDDDDETLLKRVRLANGLLLCSFGIPFFHMGQEIALSKKGNDNTYNVLKLNQMDWTLVDERYEMVNFLKGLIHFRKKLKLFSLHSREDVGDAIEFNETPNCVIMECHQPDLILGAESALCIINPTDNIENIPLDGEYDLVFSSPGKLPKIYKVTNYLSAPRVLAILIKR